MMEERTYGDSQDVELLFKWNGEEASVSKVMLKRLKTANRVVAMDFLLDVTALAMGAYNELLDHYYPEDESEDVSQPIPTNSDLLRVLNELQGDGKIVKVDGRYYVKGREPIVH